MHKIVLYLRSSPRVWNIGNPKTKKPPTENRKGNKKLRVSAYWKHRNTRPLRYGHGKYPSALRCARTTQWEYDPWHKRTAGPHLCCTWERSEASRGPSTKSASSVLPSLSPLPFLPLPRSLARTHAREPKTKDGSHGRKRKTQKESDHNPLFFSTLTKMRWEERDEDFTSGEEEQRRKSERETSAAHSARTCHSHSSTPVSSALNGSYAH
jgi:hypothetical protein